MCISLLGDVGRRPRHEQVLQAEVLAALVQHEFMKPLTNQPLSYIEAF